MAYAVDEGEQGGQPPRPAVAPRPGSDREHRDRQHQREHRGRDDPGRAADAGAEDHGPDDAHHHRHGPRQRRGGAVSVAVRGRFGGLRGDDMAPNVGHGVTAARHLDQVRQPARAAGTVVSDASGVCPPV